MHYQSAPHAETRLVRCTTGAVYDVIVDLRRLRQLQALVPHRINGGKSPHAVHSRRTGTWVLTLRDETEVFYQMSEFYTPEFARGVRWNDPAFGIEWPEKIQVMSDRDRLYPDFSYEHRPQG